MDVTPLPKLGGAAKITSATRKQLHRRSLGMCEVRAVGCDGPASQAHHILRASQGGRGDLENLLHVCFRCHHHIHLNPDEAFRNGWLKRGVK